jgi:hypothetical protein
METANQTRPLKHGPSRRSTSVLTALRQEPRICPHARRAGIYHRIRGADPTFRPFRVT